MLGGESKNTGIFMNSAFSFEMRLVGVCTSVCEGGVYGNGGIKGAGDVLPYRCHSTMSLFSIRFSCGCNSKNKLHLHFVLGMNPSLNTSTVLDVSKVTQTFV